MNKKRWVIILAFLFLVQSLSILDEVCAGTYPLSPPTKVSLNKLEIPPEQIIYDVLQLSLVLYNLDVINREPKPRIIETLSRDYPDYLVFAGVRFDLDHIDIGKKGWTRYYPFSIGGKPFIIRMFLRKELAYQPKVTVLYEGSLENPAIIFQVLPGINEILNECRIKPHDLYPASRAVARSP